MKNIIILLAGVSLAVSLFWLASPPQATANHPTSGFVLSPPNTAQDASGDTNRVAGAGSSQAFDWAEVIRGDALVGVDHLGRVLIAVDEKPIDGLVDQYFLFTSGYRLDGPWSRRIQKATIVFKGGSFTLLSSPPTFVVSLAVEGTEPQHIGYPPEAEVISHHEGVELVRMPDDSESVFLNSIYIDDVNSWPDSFEYDVLAPGTQCTNDSDCDAGGSGASACGVSGCPPPPPTSCSVNCTKENTFACCKCYQAGGAYCRCRGCYNPNP